MKWATALAGALVVCCASAPRPRVLGEIDAAREAPSAIEARRLAPQAHAHAEKLRAEAERAFGDGDRAAAQILGEHALAAYERAFVLSRLTRAEERLAKAKLALAKARTGLAELDERQKRLAAEADALELKVKVARDALPLVPNEPAGPEREKARREAANAMVTQARLLCVATQLLAPKAPNLAGDLDALEKLSAALATKPEATPIDDAIRLRSSCLRRLTLARRGATKEAPAAGKTDVLLEQLSRARLAPKRDDRGVVVTLRDAFSRSGLTARAAKSLEALALVAKAHPDFPVLIVTHAARDSKAAAAAAREAFTSAGATRVQSADAGASQPLLPRSRRGATARNSRLEVVFVSPTS